MDEKKDVWDELWTRKVTPEDREDWLYEVKVAGGAFKERCQYHKEQSEERGRRVSTLRKSNVAFMASLVQAEKRIKELEEELKDGAMKLLEIMKLSGWRKVEDP